MKIWIRNSSYMPKYPDSKAAIMFDVPLICWGCNVNARICVCGPNYFIVRYMDVADSKNYSRFSVKNTYNSGRMH